MDLNGESNRELVLRKLGAAAVAVKQTVRVHPESPSNNGLQMWDAPVEPHQWRGFDFADMMEQGLAPGITLGYIEPPVDPTIEQRLRVHRPLTKPDTWVLATENGETLMLACPRTDSEQPGTCYDFFIARDGEPPLALGPAFRLESNAAKDEWTLCSVRCEQCESRGKRKCGVRELARMTHYTEEVGESEAFCMDVRIPELYEDGSSVVLCPVCCDGHAESSVMTALTSRRPRWNPKNKNLALDFRGRVTMASAKNFQLEVPSYQSNVRCVKLLFGKVGAQSFVLDYSYPLGTVQAFAAAVSTSHWK